MARPRGVLDASVLYQEPIRSLLLWIAAEGGFEPFWTERILEETKINLIESAVVSAQQWERVLAAMSRAFPNTELDQAAADVIEDRMPNHEKDRHVLAAAVVGDADSSLPTISATSRPTTSLRLASGVLTRTPSFASCSTASRTSSGLRWTDRSPTCADPVSGLLRSC